jgi:hypothetical protein
MNMNKNNFFVGYKYECGLQFKTLDTDIDNYLDSYIYFLKFRYPNKKAHYIFQLSFQCRLQIQLSLYLILSFILFLCSFLVYFNY